MAARDRRRVHLGLEVPGACGEVRGDASPSPVAVATRPAPGGGEWAARPAMVVTPVQLRRWLLLFVVSLVFCGWAPLPEDLASRLGCSPGRPAAARYDAKEVWKRLRLARFNLPFPDDPQANDLAGVISSEELGTLRQILLGLEKRTGVEVTVVTVKSAAAHGAKNPQELAEDFLYIWGTGNPKTRDGILLLISRDDSRAVLAFGDGWKRPRADEVRKAVDRAVGQHVRSGRYAVAALAGAREIAFEIERPVPLSKRPWFKPAVTAAVVAFLLAVGHSLATTGEGGWGHLVVHAFVQVLMLLLAILAASSRRRRHRWFGGSSGSWGGGYDSGSSGGWSGSGRGGSWGNW